MKKPGADEAMIWCSAYSVALAALVIGESIRGPVRMSVAPPSKLMNHVALEAMDESAARLADHATKRILEKLAEVEGRTKQ